MNLPLINVPKYKVKLPSSNEEIEYRPFLVGEQKILLMAMEDGNEKAVVDALRQIITQCTNNKVDAYKLPNFDLEYLFIHIRMKSVSEVIEMKIKSEEEGKWIDHTINLEEVTVKKNESHTNIIMLDDNIGIKMKYPTFEMMQLIEEDSEENHIGLSTIKMCIDNIFTDDEVYDVSDKKMLDEWLGQLTLDHLEKITNFFNTMPKIILETSYYDKYVEKEKKYVVEGITDFFT